jgi:ribosome-interacting GTPase 1
MVLYGNSKKDIKLIYKILFMPTNLPPEYFKVEKRYKTARTTEEKIAVLEEMMGIIPKHKGTDKLRADLRKRLSRLKTSAEEKKSAARHESIFHIDKEGAGRVIMVGPPNVGKSALVNALTNATPQVSESPFTTWTPTPGMMQVEDIQIQLIDTPTLHREHIEPEMIDLIRTADLLLLVIDLQADALQQLQEMVTILSEHKFSFDQQGSTGESSGYYLFLPHLVLVNKHDNEELDEDFEVFCVLLEKDWPLISMSATTGRHLDKFKNMIFEKLEIIRVYSKPPGKDPEMSAPFVLKKGSTIEELAGKVHKDFIENLKTARVWGKDVYDGQMVSRDHILYDGDIVELHT